MKVEEAAAPPRPSQTLPPGKKDGQVTGSRGAVAMTLTIGDVLRCRRERVMASLATQAVQDPRGRLARDVHAAAHSIALNFPFPPKKKIAWDLAASPATFLTHAVLLPSIPFRPTLTIQRWQPWNVLRCWREHTMATLSHPTLQDSCE